MKTTLSFKFLLKIKIYFVTLLICFLTVVSIQAKAEGIPHTPPPPAPTETWHFLFAPYGWFSSIDADITLNRITKHVAIPFSKIFHHLDFAGEAHFEAGRGPWTLMLDPTYIKLSAHVDRRFDNTHVTSETLLIDSGIFYRVAKTTENANHPASFELLGGVRYLGLDNRFNFSRLPNRNVSRNTHLFVPILGGRIKYDLMPKLHSWLRGDVGGFGIDNVNDTWSTTLGLSYTVHQHVDLGIAYRVLGINYSKTFFKNDILLYGPLVGLGFTF